MTIEPTNAFTVCIRAVKRSDEGRTLQDYQDDLRRRFGKLPSWPELAKAESRAMRLRADGRPPVEMSDDTKAKMVAAKREKGMTTLRIILDAITAPMTLADISTASGVPISSVDWVLRGALDDGKVTRVRFKRVYLWERAA